MSRFKMKRGQESKVNSLAKEDGSLIFSLNGANNSTVRLDQTVNGTVQRLGISVDKAKDADGVIDYNEPTRHIKIGYAGAGLSTSNLNYIAGYTNNGTQIKDVSKDVLKNWLGTMGSADSAKVIEPFENATADVSRNVWFSDSGKRNKPVYNDNFKYNPVSQILTTNISGSAENATTARYLFQANEGGAAGKNGWVKAISIQIKAWYCNSPLMFAITQRGRSGPTFLYVYFLNVGSADPSLGTFSYSGSPITAKIIKSATSIWDIWIYKTEGYDSIGVMMAQYDFPYIGPKVVITYPDVFSESDPGTGTSPSPFGNVSHSVNSDALGGSSLSQVLASAGGGKFLPLAGGTMTGTITATTGNQKGIKIGNQWITSASDTNGEVVLQGGHLRFGTTAWDYNQWAGLKYNHSNKGIYLGIADGSQFIANSPQSGGSIYTPGIDNIYVGASTSQKVLTTSNYTSITDGRYVKKSGDIMTGALNLQSAFKGITTQALSGNTIKTGNNNVTITLPTSNNDTSNAVYMYANQNGPDIGIIYISPDTAFIANSGDTGYVFRVIDKDVNTNTNSNDGMLLGVRQSREGLDVRSSIFPTNNLTYSLGSSDLKWNNAYASTFHGYLNGIASNAQKLEGHPASYFAVASGTSSNVVENGMYLLSNTSQVNNRFSVKNGQLTSGNTNFPSNLLLAASSTDYPQLTGDSSGTTKNYSILHFGNNAYRHDIVMACSGTNTGIIYAFATTANTGGRLARIMDSLNYSGYMYKFDNQITFSKGLIANSPSSTVLIDGGSY